MDTMDKPKDNGIIDEQTNLLHLPKEVLQMAQKDAELLNSIYRDISEKLGIDTAMDIYQLFKGQQITFPVHLFNAKRIQKEIIKHVRHHS